MSRGHTSEGGPSPEELDTLLEEVLSNPKIKQRLAKPFKLDTTYDTPLLGSSAIGGRAVYLDRHLTYPGKPFGILPLQKRWIDVKPALIRHERLEQAIEDIYGWPYLLAHYIATHWEEQLIKQRGFDPTKYEKLLDPYIKADEHEKLKRIPTDLDLRPLMSGSDPDDKSILAHTQKTAQREKTSHPAVGYMDKSPVKGRQCSACNMFVETQYGGNPSCTLVKDPIAPQGVCRRFKRGSLAG